MPVKSPSQSPSRLQQTHTTINAYSPEHVGTHHTPVAKVHSAPVATSQIDLFSLHWKMWHLAKQHSLPSALLTRPTHPSPHKMFMGVDWGSSLGVEGWCICPLIVIGQKNHIGKNKGPPLVWKHAITWILRHLEKQSSKNCYGTDLWSPFKGSSKCFFPLRVDRTPRSVPRLLGEQRVSISSHTSRCLLWGHLMWIGHLCYYRDIGC